jgi:crotonobetainyl-CoA:carnitine CoA-transferase CaiB-like acyl-CoA transferase
VTKLKRARVLVVMRADTACQSIIAALYSRLAGRTKGQHLQLSMLDAGIFFFWPDAMSQRNFNLVQPPLGHPLRDLEKEPVLDGAEREAELLALWNDPQDDDGSEEWYERRAKRAASQFCYPTKDGAAAMMFWRNCPWFPRICAAFDTSGTWLAEQERLMVDPAAELLPAMAAVWAKHTNEEMDALFKEHDLPGNTIVDIDSLHLHPQVVAGGSIVQRDLGGRHGVVREPRPPTLFEKTPAKMGGAAPWRGQHTAEVLRELGVSEEELDEMEKAGVFGKLGRDGTSTCTGAAGAKL